MDVLGEGLEDLEARRNGIGDRVERRELHEVGVVLQDVSADGHDEGLWNCASVREKYRAKSMNALPTPQKGLPLTQFEHPCGSGLRHNSICSIWFDLN